MKNKIFYGILISILVFILAIGGIIFYSKKFYSPNFISEINLLKIKDGAYEGEYKSLLVSARVKVEVKKGRIKNINIIEHKHGRGKRGEEITNSVLSSQSLKVNPISGATVSSKVILKAIESALKKGL